MKYSHLIGQTQATGGPPRGHEYSVTELPLIISTIPNEEHLKALLCWKKLAHHIKIKPRQSECCLKPSRLYCVTLSFFSISVPQRPIGTRLSLYILWNICPCVRGTVPASSLSVSFSPPPLRLPSLSVSGVTYMEVRRPCRVMILVNPHSGRGQALQLFTGHVQGMLTEATVPYTLVTTGNTHTRCPLLFVR